MLRLTLRTLLAYLDDTLEPGQARDIGKKVAESDVAQQTVERIKTVTRRRRLSAPRVEPDDHSTDPNVIAEYLDNVLPSDQVTDLETAALENDTRLAEVAACHQILTLVLGEPAKVPQTARRQMYKLVRGPESLPYRKPTEAPVVGVAAPQVVDEYQDDDLLESLLGPRNVLWMVALLVAVGLLAVSIYLAIPPAPPAATQGYVAVAPAARPDPKPKPTEVVPVKKPDAPPAARDPGESGPPPREVGGNVAPATKPPETERTDLAAWDGRTHPLLFRRPGTDGWENVAVPVPPTAPADPKAPPKAAPADLRVSSKDTLLALPGFLADLKLDTKVRVRLHGQVPDAGAGPGVLAESRVTLYVAPPALDADLTLHAGRIFLSAPEAAGPKTVQVRVRGEVWVVTLADARTEVGIDLIGEPPPGSLGEAIPESPRAVLSLGVLAGSAAVRIETATIPVPQGAVLTWDSQIGLAALAPADDRALVARWLRPTPKDAALDGLVASVRTIGKEFAVEFNAIAQNEMTEKAPRRVLAMWMLGAVNDLSSLIDALDRSDLAPPREAAARALVHWVAQDPEREQAFATELDKKTAVSPSRDVILPLVRGTITADKDVAVLFGYLTNEKVAVRELARLQLARIDPMSARDSKYDAATGRQAKAWQDLFEKRAAKAKK